MLFKQLLNDDWSIFCEGYSAMNANIPTSLYAELLRHGFMDDPFYRDNEYTAREISRKDCTFKKQFSVDSKTIAMKKQQLVFYGIDTIADIYLNGKLLFKADNMHRTWRIDVTGKLYLTNTLEVFIKSPMEYIAYKQSRLPLWGADQAITGFPHIRKAHCMFGWDWGPQLPDMGIFRSIELVAYDTARIEDVHVLQEHKNGHAKLDISITAEQALSGEYSAACTLLDADGNEVCTCDVITGNGIGSVSLTVENPKLWWPNGLGDSYLYTLKTTLLANGEAADETSMQIGLRTLTVSTQPDRYGSEFCYVVNGQKVFAMGGNYIPEDNILSRTNKDRTERLIRDCARANHNTIRVWGGGYYPDSWFFELCDKYGLIVWQDCMFACGSYYLSEQFRATVKQEIIDNIKRIRNHACIGIISANNEMEVGQKYWDSVPKSDLTTHDYIELFERLIRQICDDYAPYTFFWPSSPSSGGGFVDPGNFNKGDTHFWDVWHSNAPFEAYREHYFRFCSEFGFQSLPSMKTIQTFAEKKDMNFFSPVMESHQKLLGSNKKILSYIVDHYLYPKGFEELIYASQIMQVDAIRYGVEHWRRFRGRCMGAIYWQVNDCWPVISWSSIDYYGRWKALHYASKKFFAPVLLSAHNDGMKVVLNLSNEQLGKFSGKVRAKVLDTSLRVIKEFSFDTSVGALSSLDVATLDLSNVISEKQNERVLQFSLYDESGAHLSSNTQMFAEPKQFDFVNPEISGKVVDKGGKRFIELSAKAFARYVGIDFDGFDAVLSDNYMDICDEAVCVEILETSREVTAEEVEQALRIQSVFDIA